MAFQLLDDILDYEVTSDQFGKPVLEDVVQGVYTMPLIASLPKCEKELLPLLEKKKSVNSDRPTSDSKVGRKCRWRRNCKRFCGEIYHESNPSNREVA